MRSILPFVLLFAAFLPSAVAANPAAQTTDIAIVSADIAGGGTLVGACYIINGASIEGCDENGDGMVDFRGVRAGTYLVTETRAPAGYRAPDDAWIAVTAASPKIVGLLQVPGGGIGAGVSANVATSVQNQDRGGLPPPPWSALTPRCSPEQSGDVVAVTGPTGESLRLPVVRSVAVERVLTGGCR